VTVLTLYRGWNAVECHSVPESNIVSQFGKTVYPITQLFYEHI